MLQPTQHRLLTVENEVVNVDDVKQHGLRCPHVSAWRSRPDPPTPMMQTRRVLLMEALCSLEAFKYSAVLNIVDIIVLQTTVYACAQLGPEHANTVRSVGVHGVEVRLTSASVRFFLIPGFVSLPRVYAVAGAGATAAD